MSWSEGRKEEIFKDQEQLQESRTDQKLDWKSPAPTPACVMANRAICFTETPGQVVLMEDIYTHFKTKRWG